MQPVRAGGNMKAEMTPAGTSEAEKAKRRLYWEFWTRVHEVCFQTEYDMKQNFKARLAEGKNKLVFNISNTYYCDDIKGSWWK